MTKICGLIGFIEKAKKINGDKYDYSLVEYVNNHTKIKIICPEHGVFEQTPGNHINRKSGCPNCKNTLTTIDFIEKAKKIHGDKYDYSLVKYVDTKTKVKIICPNHGIFEQTPMGHYNSGCVKCSYEKRSNNNKLTTIDFIEKAKKIHGDKYDYSKTKYYGNNLSLKIICQIHGEFEQEANSHLQGAGCKKCGIELRSKNRKYNNPQYIIKAKRIHGDKYDYSKTKYLDSNTKINIGCLKHGYFMQTPSDHLLGTGCPKCKNDSLSLGLETFVLRANEKHNNKYDYSLVKYVNSYSNVIITCPEHGKFEQTPHSHLKGYGCMNCGKFISISEREIFCFIENELKITNIIKNDRTILNGKELDMYFPEHNLAIEFNGLYWHSELFKDKNYHLNKTEECKKQGINLIHIFEDEWIHKQMIVKSMLRNKFGLNINKIYGRKTIIKEINDNDLIRNFLDNNHIQGYVGSKYKIGLFYENELISLMTFTKSRKTISNNELSYELNRYCNKLNTSVIGGASKLFNFFILNFNYGEVVSFADRRYSNGELYLTLKFKKTKTNKPSYSYFNKNGTKRYHRFGFRKDNLKKMGKDIINKNEHEIMLDMGYFRIYDCGTIKYIYNE